MPIGDSDDLGGLKDAVTLTLGGKEVLIAESYEVRQSFFTQPASFALTLGSGATAKDIIKLAPANTEFSLAIAGKTQFVGRTDGPSAHQSGGATAIQIKGRDNLAPLHDSHVRADTSFTAASFEDLVKKVFEKIPIVGYSLFTDNSANRSRKAGVTVQQTGVPDYLEGVLTSIPTKTSIQAKVGERWQHYLAREFELAGLFLFAGADGTFVLTAPNAKQRPTYRISRQAGALRNVVNVTAYSFKDETTPRFSECIVLIKGSSGAAGRTKSAGRYVDQEMVDLGYDRPLIKKSKRASSPKEAEFLARKWIAAANRAGHQLQYTLAGHTVPSLFGGARAVWSVDTIVDVQDDELGISAPYWISDVTFRRQPQTATEITLVRPRDLIFGGGED